VVKKEVNQGKNFPAAASAAIHKEEGLSIAAKPLF
jgi:hypothetical protein